MDPFESKSAKASSYVMSSRIYEFVNEECNEIAAPFLPKIVSHGKGASMKLLVHL